MKITFYVLGLLLRYGPQHGYRLKQIIEETISDFTKIKLPTIYYHLNRLKEQGYVMEELDKDGNRPEKMVYTITEEGIRHYEDLFKIHLKESYSPEFLLDGVLYFAEGDKKSEVKNELELKEKELSLKLKNLEKHKDISIRNIHELGRFSAEAIFEHHRCHLEAELQWMRTIIEGLSE